MSLCPCCFLLFPPFLPVLLPSVPFCFPYTRGQLIPRARLVGKGLNVLLGEAVVLDDERLKREKEGGREGGKEGFQSMLPTAPTTMPCHKTYLNVLDVVYATKELGLGLEVVDA